jgi:hypothetical protein
MSRHGRQGAFLVCALETRAARVGIRQVSFRPTVWIPLPARSYKDMAWKRRHYRRQLWIIYRTYLQASAVLPVSCLQRWDPGLCQARLSGLERLDSCARPGMMMGRIPIHHAVPARQILRGSVPQDVDSIASCRILKVFAVARRRHHPLQFVDHAGKPVRDKTVLPIRAAAALQLLAVAAR